VFVYRWGWLFFAERSQSFLISYLVLGMVVGVLTVIGMMREGASEN
jgi:F0F1-type ATP synthase assembly protein I